MDANVTNVEMHPDYIQNTGTDIAILYLSEDVNFTGEYKERTTIEILKCTERAMIVDDEIQFLCS